MKYEMKNAMDTIDGGCRVEYFGWGDQLFPALRGLSGHLQYGWGRNSSLRYRYFQRLITPSKAANCWSFVEYSDRSKCRYPR